VRSVRETPETVMKHVERLIEHSSDTATQNEHEVTKKLFTDLNYAVLTPKNVSDFRGNPKQGRAFHLPLSETAPLDRKTPERWDEELSQSRCYPSPKSKSTKGDSS
jgi:hypothetical protein